MATGENFSLALSEKGEVFSWGINSDGQLGHGHKSDLKIPKKIDFKLKVVDIACGDSHSMLLSGKAGEANGRTRLCVRFWERETRTNGPRRPYGEFGQLQDVSTSC